MRGAGKVPPPPPLQRFWACIFHNLALTLAVSAPALEDYINGNPSCPGPAWEARAVPVRVGVYRPSLLVAGSSCPAGARPGQEPLLGCKLTLAPCKVSLPGLPRGRLPRCRPPAFLAQNLDVVALLAEPLQWGLHEGEPR